jgi:hypothetical protein
MPPTSMHIAYSFAALVNKPGFVTDYFCARARPSFNMIHGHALVYL